MAKVGKARKNKNVRKPKTSPTKTFNGKVRKVRINIRKLRKGDNSRLRDFNANLIECGCQRVTSKVRACIVKLRRFPKNRTDIAQNNDNRFNNNIFQAQSKANENKINVNMKSEIVSTSLEHIKKRLDEMIEGNLETKRKCIVEDANAKTVGTRSKTKRALHTSQPIVDKSEDSPTKIFPLRSTLIADITNKSNAISTIKIQRNCYIKINRIPVFNDKKEVQQSGDLSTLTSTRCCVQKLQRTPVKNKSNMTVQKPLNPKHTRTCKVRLQRTRLVQKEIVDQIGSSETFGDSTVDHTSDIIPEIDEAKRNNFLNLSLTKRSRKIKNNNGKVIENKETQDLNKSPHNFNNNKENIELSEIEHICKLSLKKAGGKNRNKTNNLKLTHFDSMQNPTVCSELKQNSIFGCGIAKNKNTSEERINGKIRDNAPPKNRSPSENLVNKKEKIEDILNSLGDDDDNEETDKNKGRSKKVQNTPSPSKSNKFFHNKKVDSCKNTLLTDSPKPTLKISFKKQNITKKRRFLTKRSSLSKRDNVYEFLSQSQVSDSDGGKPLDPAADIIKKLIDQGKVRVATNYRGKGKPIFKRKIAHKERKRVGQTVAKNSKQLKNKIKDIAVAEKEIVDELEVDNLIEDFDSDEIPPDLHSDMKHERPENNTKIFNNHIIKKHVNDQEGTFSRLARSVLINQTVHSDIPRRKNPSHLLETVKKYVSTPKNKQPSPEPNLHSDLSPIAMLSPRTTKASPWRVDEDIYLPRLFNFSISSTNLPSFSSDFIPSTPKKEKSKSSSIRQQQPSIVDSTVFPPLMESQNSEPDIHNILPDNLDAKQPQSLNLGKKQFALSSSLSLNGSNAENIPPSKQMYEGNVESQNILDFKQLPNPRKALSYRSPLKNINILEVVRLPPLKAFTKSTSNKESNKEAEELSGFKENVGQDSSQLDKSIIDMAKSPQRTYSRRIKNFPKEDLFGFEEYLTQTDLYNQEYNSLNNNNISFDEINLTTHNKLQDLRKLKPKENDLELISLKENCGNPLQNMSLFDSESKLEGVNGRRQRGIKEMLSLRMIHPEPSTSTKALKQMYKRNLNEIKEANSESKLEGVSGMRQKGIEEMLSSTMIHPEPSTSKETLKQMNKRNLNEIKEANSESKLEGVSGMRQKGIEEMLSSTMIHPEPSTSKEALKQMNKINLNEVKEANSGSKLEGVNSGRRQRGIEEMLSSTMIHPEPSTSKEALKQMNKINLNEIKEANSESKLEGVNSGRRQRGIEEMLSSTMIHPEPSTSKEALKQMNKINLNEIKEANSGSKLEGVNSGRRQRGIEEMLSSTMIHPEPSTSKEALKQMNKRNLKEVKEANSGSKLEGVNSGRRQRGIEEMLSSTMIHPEPSTSKEALKQMNKRNLNDVRETDSRDFDLSELFHDPEQPENTFNENEAHRTYLRPYKRKRRLKAEKYVAFFESDDSGDEQNSNEEQKHNQSNETDTSSENAPKKKQHHKEPKENHELREFVMKFNEMCKEVESFELVIEKGA